MSRKYVSSPTAESEILQKEDKIDELSDSAKWPEFASNKLIDLSESEPRESEMIALLYFMTHDTVSGYKVSAIKSILELFFQNEKKIKQSYDKDPLKFDSEALERLNSRKQLIDLLKEQWY